jgi:hypothetical protein
MIFGEPLSPCGRSSEKNEKSATRFSGETVASARRLLLRYYPSTSSLIGQYEKELAHLLELRRENMHIFVEAARKTLQDLWDELFFSEEQMAEFTPAFTGNALFTVS